MSQPVIQTSFSSGEWSPDLNARVDLSKYHSGAALLRNFYVDYRGGASTCPGSRYILQARIGSKSVRLIPFSVSFTINYAVEFGDFYLRFYRDGAPVLEAAQNIAFISQANPAVIDRASHGYSVGDWVFVTGVGGMSQMNNRYFIVASVPNANQFAVNDLFGVPVNSTSYGAYTSGGTVQRVYTIPSPYAAADLAQLKFSQNVSTLVLCHPSYVPYILTFISNTNWTLIPITFGSTIAAPAALGAVTTGAGSVNYSYTVTAVDANGQESVPSPIATITNAGAPGNGYTHTLNWSAVNGATSYNIYRAGPSVAGVVPTGAAFGFVGSAQGTATAFADTFNGITPVNPTNYDETIPIPKNPFQGAGVDHVDVTAPGSYTTVPSVTFGAPPAGGSTATGVVVLNAVGTPTIGVTETGNQVGDIIRGDVFSVAAVVASIDGAGRILTFQPMTFPGSDPGAVTSGSVPTNPVPCFNMRTGSTNFTVNFTWGVGSVPIISKGSGYTSPPSVTFSSGAATATAVLESTTAGNPQVPSYFDQRLVLAAKPNTPQTFDASQPKAYFNFNVSDPLLPTDAITAQLVSTKLNTIKAMIPTAAGLIMLGDIQAWLVNGGGVGVPISAVDTAGNPQAYAGASDVPPITVNYDILYVQAKNSFIRNITYNFYTNIYTGTDVSVLSSHLFYGFQITEWAYAEEPFKIVWCVRNDGNLLSLTYLKEQEMIGWAHRDTLGLFKSVCSIPETVTLSNGLRMIVDAVYVSVQRVVQGLTLQYIERFAERIFPYGVEDAWCVDSGLQSAPAISNAASLTTGVTLTASAAGPAGTGGITVTASSAFFNSGNVGMVLRLGGGIMTIQSFVSPTNVVVFMNQAITEVYKNSPTIPAPPLPAPPGTWTLWFPASTGFAGGEHLAGQTCTGLADGVVIPSFVMPVSGSFTIPAAATKVTVGLAYEPQLQTLALDTGEPTVQSKRKKLPGVVARCKDTLGLSIGRTLATVVPMKDLVVGNVGSQTNTVVTNRMVTGDAFTKTDSTWDVAGQYFITQPNPMPATILGVIPDVVIGEN